MHLIWNNKSIGCLWWQHWDNLLQETPVFSDVVLSDIIRHSPLFIHDGTWFISDDNGPLKVDGVEIMFKNRWFEHHVQTNQDISWDF